jgi:hypothetical protein
MKDNSMKKYSATGYLIGAIFALLLSGLWLVKAWPFFIQVFIPFPKLEQAQIYEGKLQIVGKEHYNNKLAVSVAPAYYVVDKNGIKNQVFWGLKGDENTAYSNTYQGMDTKVWFHPLFGVLNEQSYPTDKVLEEQERNNYYSPRGKLKKGQPFGTNYEEYKYFVQNQLSGIENYLLRALPCIATLFFAIYYFMQFMRTRELEKEEKNG